jgi:phage terminase Nu1 subunit (DNA packaging protein)
MLNSTEIANFTGISDRTIRDWQSKGLIPKSDDMKIVVKGIIKYLQGKQEKRQKNGDEEELTKQKCRLTEAQANKVELENAEKEGTLVDGMEFLSLVIGYIQACKAKLLPMGGKLAPRLALLDTEEKIKVLIDKIMNEALRELGEDYFVERIATVEASRESVSPST